MAQRVGHSGRPILQLLDKTYFLDLRGTGSAPRARTTENRGGARSCASAQGA